MSSLSSADLQKILEKLDYPYPVRFSTTTPKFPIYPYITIRKQPPVSTTTDVTDINQTDGFEITLFVRYTRDQGTEERDQSNIETIILSAIENTDFGASAVYMESRHWNRVPVPRPYGSQSILKIQVTDKRSASGEGILGSEMSLQTAHGNIRLFSLSTQEGPTLTQDSGDDGILYRDAGQVDTGDITFEWESTPTNDAIVRGLSNGEFQTVILVKGAVKRTILVLFGATTKRGQFDKVERATTRLTVQFMDDSQKAYQFRLDLILIN